MEGVVGVTDSGMERRVDREARRDGLRFTGAQVQEILVDVHDLRAAALRLHRERVADLDRFGEVDRAFPVTMMQLSRSDQRKETRRIDFIGELLGRDLY